MAARGRAVALVAAVLVAGCVPRRPAPPLRPMTAEGLLSALAARRNAVTSVRARARVRSRLTAVGSRQALLVRRPEAVRIDVLHPFGLALALGAQDGLLWAYRPDEATRYQSAATAENLRRLLGTPVAVPDVVDVLLGVPPARSVAGTPSLATTATGEYRLTLPIPGGVQTLRFAGDTLDVLGAEEVRADGTVLRVVFGDYRDGFPHAIAVASPTTDGEMALALDAVEPNAVIDPALFAPPPAPRVRPLEGLLEAE
jgi:hypothetical protein